jgi:drug/metabolite transporter (DMT)-like permease/GNAT superfamily N-acetyltransferase
MAHVTPHPRVEDRQRRLGSICDDPQRVRLADGAEIGLRPIHDDDEARIARAFVRLSPQSRRRRFLSLAHELTPAQQRYLTIVDHRDHEAVVATEPDSGEIIGVARYVRLRDRPLVAEVATAVIDEWQSRGIGQALFNALTERAERNGVERFAATVSPENAPIKHWLRRTGTAPRQNGHELEYEFPVTALACHRAPIVQAPAAPARHRRELIGIGLVLFSAAGFGSLAVLAQLAYGAGVSVFGLLFGRFVIAAILLWLIALALRRPLPGRRLALVGLALGCGYSLVALSFAASLRHIDANLADLLEYAYPTLVSLGAVGLGRERWSRRRATALAVAGTGILLALAGGGTGVIDPLGVALALIAALIYAAYVLASASLLGRVDPLVLAALVATGAALVFSVQAAATNQLGPRGGLSGLGLLVAVALSSSVLGTSAFMAGIRRLGPSRASIVSSAEPALTALFAFAALGEHFGPVQLIGAGLVLASVPILELKRRPTQSTPRNEYPLRTSTATQSEIQPRRPGERRTTSPLPPVEHINRQPTRAARSWPHGSHSRTIDFGAHRD